MGKRKLLIIVTFVLMLTQTVLPYDKVWIFAQETESVDEADEVICIEQSSEPQNKDEISEKDEEVIESETETKNKSESEIIIEKQPETEITHNEISDLKKYAIYILAAVGGVIVLLLLLLLFKKSNKEPELKEKSRFVAFLADRNEKIMISIPENGKVTLGRKGKADVALKEDGELADIHMTLWYDQERYWVEKQQTEKSLKFNGRELAKGEVRALYNQAVLEIGNTRYWFIEKAEQRQ